jgi:hypothetical protein
VKGRPVAWVRGAAGRRSLQWPWVSGGEFPLCPPTIYTQPSIVLCEWMSGSGGPTFSRTGLGVKSILVLLGCWPGAGNHRTMPRQHRSPRPLGRAPPPPLAPQWGCWEGGLHVGGLVVFLLDLGGGSSPAYTPNFGHGIGSGRFSAKMIVSELPFLGVSEVEWPKFGNFCLSRPCCSFFLRNVEGAGQPHCVRLNANVFSLGTAHGRPYTCAQVNNSSMEEPMY